MQLRWAQNINPETKTQVKELALKTLHSSNVRAGSAAANLIVSIASIELPRNEWPELMGVLVQNVGGGNDALKQSSLTTIGYICESQDPELRASLTQHSNAILTAVVQGARREEPNMEVRFAAIAALSDAVDFVRTNMDNEGERNYIMQVVCEATQADEVRVQAGAFGCLNRIMGSYYEKMRFYMEKALFGLSIMGMKSEEEEVAKLAIEFWCTVCEEEIAIEDDNAEVSTCEFRSVFELLLTSLFRPTKKVLSLVHSSVSPASPLVRSSPFFSKPCADRTRMPATTSTMCLALLTRLFSFMPNVSRAKSSHPS